MKNIIYFLYLISCNYDTVGTCKVWSYSPGQSKESIDDERSNPRVLCCLQNSGWVWFVCDVKFCCDLYLNQGN